MHSHRFIGPIFAADFTGAHEPQKEDACMYELDCLGDMCPIPIMKLKQCKQIKEKGGQLKLVTDHSCVVESISDYCRKQKLQIHVVEPMNGIWELYIKN